MDTGGALVVERVDVGPAGERVQRRRVLAGRRDPRLVLAGSVQRVAATSAVRERPR